jgi:hypothetical protein
MTPTKREAALARDAMRRKQLVCTKQAPRPAMKYGQSLKAVTTTGQVRALDSAWKVR